MKRTAGSFLEEPPVSPHVQALFDDDLRDDGYVGNVTRGGPPPPAAPLCAPGDLARV